MDILSVDEVVGSVDAVKKHNKYKDKYIYMTGYLSNDYLFGSEDDCINNTSNKIKISSFIQGGIREKILHRNNLTKSSANLMCLLKQPKYIEIGHIFKIELLNNEGEIIDSIKVDEATIPKELHRQI